jgi:hypothetical protein
MDLLLEGIPNTMDYERLERYISAYAKTFTLKALNAKQDNQSGWNATLSIPHKISSLMILEVLDGQKCASGTISVKILERDYKKLYK